MPLNLASFIDVPATRQGGYSPLAAIAKADAFVADQQKAREAQAEAQRQQLVNATVQKYPDDPDKAIAELRAVDWQAAQKLESQVTEHRTKMIEMRGKELENLHKLGEVSDQQVKAEAAALQRGALEDWVNLYDVDPKGAEEKARFLMGPEKWAQVETAAKNAATSRINADTQAAQEKRLANPPPPAPQPFTLSQGQRRFDATGKEIASVAPRPLAQGGGGARSGTGAPNDDNALADAIVSGQQPPELTGLYGNTLAVRAALARKGYDLTKAAEDWKATQKYLQTLNGAQQTRLRQAVTFTRDSLDIVQGLADEWKGGGFPLLNKGQLIAAKNGAMGPKAQSLANRMDAQISDIVSELGTVYKGGNSSTDESLKLAAKNLQSDWSQKTMTDAINLIRKNLSIRENSIRFGSPVANEGNPYAPQAGGSPAASGPKPTGRFNPATGKVEPVQ